MLERLSFILAQDDDDVAKIIFGAIAALIWAVSAFVSWANKKTQEAKRRAQEDMMRRAAQQPSPSRPAPVPRPPPRIAQGIATRHPEVLLPPAQHPYRQRPPVRQVPMPTAPMMRPPPLPPKPKRRAKPIKAPMPPPLPVARMQEEIESAVILDETPVSRRETHQRTSALAQMLTPRTLRNQFVLLEILQPPLALRDEHRL